MTMRNKVNRLFLIAILLGFSPRPSSAGWFTEKLPKTVTGTVYLSGDNTIVALVTEKRIKVNAYALFTQSTTTVIATFKDGTSTSKWTVPLVSFSSSTVFGANLALAPPSFLFATSPGNLLNLNLSSGNTVYYSISYWDDDAN